MNRRQFVNGLAAISASSYSRILGANNRVGFALIGAGRRGTEVATAFVADPRVDLVSLCDVYDKHRGAASAKLTTAGHRQPALTPAHEDVLSSKDVEAVLIATPDHLHFTIATAALTAGKHVYLEKPTIHHWEEGEPLLQLLAKSPKSVLQCGTQQRSGPHYLRAKHEIFDTKKLGEIVSVRAIWSNFPWQQRHIQPQPKPANLDWDRFLGPAPKVPYDTARYDSWRYFPDYGGGLLADILTHWVDVAQWMMSDAEPQTATALGGIYDYRDGRQNPDTVNAIVQYRNWNLSFESSVLPLRNDRPSVLFQGTEGSLDLARSSYTFQGKGAQPLEVLAEGTLESAHVRNFLDAVTNGSQPSAPLTAGLQATRPVQMCLRSYWQKKIVTGTELPAIT